MFKKTIPLIIILTAFTVSFAYNITFCRNAEVMTHWSQHIDGLFYQAIARTVVEKGIIGYNEVRPTSFRPPLYPLFLSGIYYILGYNFFIVRILQSILHGLTCLLIFLIGRNIFNRNVGITAAILFAVNPFLIFFSGEIGTETLFTFLIAATIYSITLFLKSKNKTLVLIMSGLLFTASMMTRTIFLSLLPFLIIWLYYVSDKKNAWKNVIVFFLSFFIALMPWIIRNYSVHGHFVLSGTNMGHNLNIGALMEGVDYGEALKKFKEIAGYDYKDLENPKNRSLPTSEYELQKQGIERALKLIAADPAKWIKVRALNAFNLWSNNWEGNYAKKFAEEKSSYIKTASHYYYLFILFFGILGIAFTAKESDRDKRNILYLILLLFLAGTAGYCVFQTGKRYRVPIIDPYLAIYTSYFLFVIKDKISKFTK